jgi:hypothetical protein
MHAWLHPAQEKSLLINVKSSILLLECFKNSLFQLLCCIQSETKWNTNAYVHINVLEVT